MRPRRIAAENFSIGGDASHDLSSFNEAAANRRGKQKNNNKNNLNALASMRPRRIAAENDSKIARGLEGWQASMRPRRIAAENQVPLTIGLNPLVASMRPRRIAAENGTTSETKIKRLTLQ